MADGLTVLSESPLRLKVAPPRRRALLGLLGSLVLVFGAPLPLLEDLPALALLVFVLFSPAVYVALGELLNHRIFELGDALRVTEAPLPFSGYGPFPRREISEFAVRAHQRRRRLVHSIEARVNGRWVFLGTARDLATMGETVTRLSAALRASSAGAAPPASSPVGGTPAPVPVPAPVPAASPSRIAVPTAPVLSTAAIAPVASAVPMPHAASREWPHVRVLRRMAERGAPPVDALIDAVAPLGPLVRPHVGWMDGKDSVWLGAGWPEHDASLRARFDAVRMQRLSLPALAARLGRPARFRLTPSSSHPTKLFPSATWTTTPPPVDALRLLVATGAVKDAAVAEMARYWPAAAAPIELHDDAGLFHAWSFLGVVRREALVPTVESLAAAMRLLDAHRAVPYRLAQLPATFAISLAAGFDTVLPQVHVHVTGIDWNTTESLVAAAIGDGARAQRVLLPLREAGSAPTVRLQLATEGPIRVMVTAPVP